MATFRGGRSGSPSKRLISEIRKVGNKQLGTDQAAETQGVLKRAQELQQADRRKYASKLLRGKTRREHIGERWLQENPTADKVVSEVEAEKAKKGRR